MTPSPLARLTLRSVRMRSAVASVGRPVEIVAGVSIGFTKAAEQALALWT